MLISIRRIHRAGVFLLTIVGWMTYVTLTGQIDTVHQLHEIEVTAHRIDLTDIGKHTETLDSTILAITNHDHLASLLAGHTPLFIRSYGNGSLSTLGIRGGSASHTQILWNGIPLRNPMIGLLDLALIPTSFMDVTAVHYGGHGAAFGSGAVGGLISLSNEDLRHRKGLSLHLSAGSWQRRIGEGMFTYGSPRIRFSTRVFTQFMENNYRYKLNANAAERNQVHHRIQNQGLMQEMAWYPNARGQLTARLWYQYADRQIPPTTTQNISQAAQQDQNIRAVLQWSHRGEKLNWQIKSAWLDEKIDYQDTLILLYTHNRFRTWLAELETSLYVVPGVNLTTGLYTESVTATSGNYLSGTARNQHAFFSSLRWVWEDWVWRFQFREEVTGGAWSPLLLDFSTEWSGWKHLVWKASISRNYRVPTLNDLHWRPGGNPELEPEKGWTVETGIHFRSGQNKMDFKSSLTAYARTLDQWIMWLPPIKDVRNYWSPINIAKVHSHGIEARGEFALTARPWVLTFKTGLDLTWSKFGTPVPDFMIEEGDQLFYVPVENLMTGLQLQSGHWSGYYSHHWFGSSTGINEEVRAAQVGSTSVSRIFKYPHLTGTLYLQVENVWNVPYRIIERRPMPGRTILGGIKLTL